MKQQGGSWGHVFQQMKVQGLVDAKNLGAIVNASKHQGPTTSTAATTSGAIEATRTSTSSDQRGNSGGNAGGVSASPRANGGNVSGNGTK